MKLLRLNPAPLQYQTQPIQWLPNKKRDGDRCVITKVDLKLPTHSLITCSIHLETFIGTKSTNRDARSFQMLIDESFNLLCLLPDVHDMWNSGLLALKPLELSSDNTELKLFDLLTEPTSSKGLNSSTGRWLTYRDGGSLHGIRSGQVFTFKAKILPLPSTGNEMVFTTSGGYF
jgi:hypothetical protein